jgi:hypothetical protein
MMRRGKSTVAGLSDLERLLKDMRPRLDDGEYVFCPTGRALVDVVALNPAAVVSEPEGLTLVLDRSTAQDHGFSVDASFRRITLMVHSSLEAVGLTAAVSGQLAAAGISANVLAGFYHDHLFVPSDQAEIAHQRLLDLCSADQVSHRE